jgi:hypothetical protein
MLSRLPPRLHMFIREVWFVTVFYLAVVGLVAIHEGVTEPPPWWLPTAALIGTALGCLIRQVPVDIVAAHRAAAEPQSH